MKKFLSVLGACILGIGSSSFSKVNAEDYTVTLLGNFNSDTHVVAQRIIEKVDQEQDMPHHINLLNDSIITYNEPCQEAYKELVLYDLHKSKVAVIIPDYRDADSLNFIKLWINLVKESNSRCRIIIGTLGATDCIQRAFSYDDVIDLVKSMEVKEASVVDVNELDTECLYSQIVLACTAEKFYIDNNMSSGNKSADKQHGCLII